MNEQTVITVLSLSHPKANISSKDHLMTHLPSLKNFSFLFNDGDDEEDETLDPNCYLLFPVSIVIGAN